MHITKSKVGMEIKKRTLPGKTGGMTATMPQDLQEEAQEASQNPVMSVVRRSRNSGFRVLR
jgi:hypothetical protein